MQRKIELMKEKEKKDQERQDAIFAAKNKMQAIMRK